MSLVNLPVFASFAILLADTAGGLGPANWPLWACLPPF